MLNYIIYTHKANSKAADIFSLYSGSDTKSQTTFSLHRRSSSLAYHSENDVFSIRGTESKQKLCLVGSAANYQ